MVLPGGLPLGLVLPERIEESEVEHVVDSVRRLHRAEQRERALWFVPEAASPADLAQRLLTLGMRPNDFPGADARGAQMVCLEAPPPGPPGVVARPAATFDEFLQSRLVLADSMGLDDATREDGHTGSGALLAVPVPTRRSRRVRGTRRRRSRRLRRRALRTNRGVPRGWRHPAGAPWTRRLPSARAGSLGRRGRARHADPHRRRGRDVAPDPRATRLLDRRLGGLPPRPAARPSPLRARASSAR